MIYVGAIWRMDNYLISPDGGKLSRKVYRYTYAIRYNTLTRLIECYTNITHIVHVGLRVVQSCVYGIIHVYEAIGLLWLWYCMY